MKMSKVGNQTNSQDPQAVNSRVFVGNLNTFQCSKTDVERMFQRYGRLAGISMHKGYAFVQFTNPFDARNACVGEDGRTVLGQILGRAVEVIMKNHSAAICHKYVEASIFSDHCVGNGHQFDRWFKVVYNVCNDVNMVAEPKPHQTGRKRQNMALTDNDWDYYYDSYYASTLGYSASPPLGGPHLPIPPTVGKRQRLSSSSGRATKNGHSIVNGNKTNGTTNHVNNNHQNLADTALKVYSNPDILICGNCREMFTDLKEIINHKKTYCKLRFTCRCHSMDPIDKVTNGHDCTSLLCSHCKDAFPNAWDLMVHIQATHMVNIYEMGVRYSDEKDDSSGRSDSCSPHQDKHLNEDHSGERISGNGQENGVCQHNGNGTHGNDSGTEDSIMTELKENSGNAFDLENNDNDEDSPMESSIPMNSAIIADSQTLSSVLIANGSN